MVKIDIMNSNIKKVAKFLSKQDKISRVLLQRVLYIGYPHASHIVDEMQELTILQPIDDYNFAIVDSTKFIDFITKNIVKS